MGNSRDEKITAKNVKGGDLPYVRHRVNKLYFHKFSSILL